MEHPKSEDEGPSFSSNTPEEHAPSPSGNSPLSSATRDSKDSKGTKTDPPMTLLHESAFIFICCCAQLMTQLVFAESISIAPSIGHSFFSTTTTTTTSPPPAQLSWFAAAYSLTIGTFILIAGRIGDMFGHKRLFVLGWAWFALWSLVAGLSVWVSRSSAVFFDVCRALQGIGPAVLMPCALALLGRTYQPGSRKGMVFALFGAAAPSGFVVGALFSSVFAQWVWWPWAYWSTALALAVMGLVAWFVVPDDEDGNSDSGGGEEGLRDRGTFDWLGAGTGVAGLVLFNVAWNQAPDVGWDEPYVIVLLILGLLFFVAFLIVERRVKHPLVPLDSFSPQTSLVLGCMVLGWQSFGIWVYYYWQFSENLRHLSPLTITAQMVPVVFAGLVAALTTGFLLMRIPPSLIMMIAMTAFCVGSVLVATMPIEQNYWIQTFLSMVIIPFGMDMSFPCATILLSDLVPKEHQGIAASLVATIVNYSISIGLGIGGTVESHVNDSGKDLLMGYRGAWYAGIGSSFCGLLLSFYFVYHGLTRKAKKTVDETSESKA